MKRRFTILTAALALLAFLALPMGMWGQTTETLNIADYADANNWTNATQYSTAQVGDVIFTAAGGGNTGKYYTSGENWRFYQNESATITISVPEGNNLTSITPTFSVTNTGALFNGSTQITSGSAVAVSGTSVTFSVGNSGTASNGQVRFTEIEVTYATGGVILPSITAANVDIAFNATSGNIEYTVSNPVEGGVLTATTEAEWITIGTVGEEAVPFTCTINEDVVRTATVILTYTYGNDNVTKNVNVTQAANPNIPGTQNNPYTVAQARAAIDAGTGVTGVYATGIVSAIPTAWNSQYSNITFNFVDNAGDTEFLQAYRCKSSSTANASEVQVGDIVVVYGNLKNYNGTYEFDANCQLVSLTHPSILAPTFSIPAGGYAEAQSVELSCETENAVIYYTLDGTDPTNASTQYNGAISVTETTTIKAIAYVGTGNSPVAEAAYYILSDDNVYTVTEALAFGSYPQNNIFVSGIVSTAPESLISGAQLTYYISVDGQATNELEVYKGKGLNDAAFTSVDDIQVGDIVTVFGNVQDYQGTIEFGSGNYLVSFERPDAPVVPSITVDPDEVNVDAEEHDGTLGLTYENLTITDMEDFGIQYYDAEGEETTEPDWIEVLVAEQDPQIGEGYVVSYYMVENEGEARTAYFKVFALGDEDFVYSNLVTVNQAAPVVPPTPGTWVLTSLADLTEDDIFVIVGTDSDTEATYALPNDGGSSAPVATEITIVEGTISGEPATNLQWNLSGNTNDGYTFYPNGDAESWLYCSTTAASGSNNNIKVGTGDRKLFVLDENGYLVTNDDNVDRYLSIYFNSGVAQDWRGYINTNSAVAISFYKKVEAATETYTLDITGYTAGNTGGYYLIASPVNVNPANVEGMTEGTFDLYSFDQAEEDEWRNYEAQPFNLVPGKGYLYAKQATTEGEIFHFTLTGTPYSGDGMIELDYTEGGDFPGWNLVGNPYGVAAEISNDFYVMNGDGTEIIAGESEFVEPMQGVFVIAENDGDYVIFAPAVAPGSGNEKLVMNVCRERGNVIDRAIVRFGEGRQLPKFQLNANSTKLYITEGENEYAVVRSANEGEMPVSFKAAENGTYTLSVNAENMEMNYLHLIDNMTKADVDLLANPNYTFEANTTDLANRFTLVFAATGMNENTTQSFAFFNGSEWVISNMGEATLQVVDVMGRIVSSETINGNASVSLNQTFGVYMLRLVNGDNVKVQKVVVR